MFVIKNTYKSVSTFKMHWNYVLYNIFNALYIINVYSARAILATEI